MLNNAAMLKSIEIEIFKDAVSLFISVFQKGKYINEKKDRVRVMQIENFTKPLYQVFPTDLLSFKF